MAAEEKISDLMTMTTEPGIIGGIPAGAHDFGAGTNAQAVLDMPYQFDFYDGGGVDVAFLGLAQADREGNLNVSRFGARLAGAGGFINISQNAKKVVFLGTFTAGEREIAVVDGRLRIERDGRHQKFVDEVEHRTFSGPYAAADGKDVLYITERCVFRLTGEGLELAEIAPGVDVERDILAKMAFKPIVQEPREMDPRIFRPEPMGLRGDILRLPFDARFDYDDERNILYLNFEDLEVKSTDVIAEYVEKIREICEPLGHKVYAVVNYDGFELDRELEDAYLDALGSRGIDVRLRFVAPVLLVIAMIAGAFAVTRIESLRDGVLVLAGGLALAAVYGALAVTTERRRRAMREVERYSTLSPEMVILAGFDGYWTRVNPTVEVVLGYTEREALARPFMEFVHPDDRERTEEEARRVVAGATALAFENRIVCKDGSYKWIEWTVTPVPEERVMFGVGRDVTERRRSESEQAALQRIATLVAQEVPRSEVFSAIAEEIGGLLGTEEIRMLRFDSDCSAVVVGSSGRRDAFPLGSQQHLDGDSIASRVLRTGRPARIDDYWAAAGPLAETARSIGVRAVVGVPVLVEGRLWGVITTGSTHDGALPPDTEARLDQFTKLMATAIANAEARAEVHRLADEQAALRQVAVLVAQQPSPSEVFTAVTQAVGPLLDADLAVLHVFPGDGTAMTIASWSADGPVLPIGTRFPLDGDSLAARIFESGAPARMHSYDEAWEREAMDLARSLRVRSAVGAPILVEGKLWGALMAATRGVEPWAGNAETRIAAFTELVATAIANAESRGALAELADEQAGLRRVATLVAQGASPQDLFEAVAEEVGRLLPVGSATMGRFEPDGSVTTVASWSTTKAAFPAGRRWPTEGTNVAWMVLQTGRSARLDDFSAATDPIGVTAREAGIKSAVGSPVVVKGHLWGVMTATSTEGPMPPGTEARLAST